MKTYDVLMEGWIAGAFRRPEDGPVRLSDEDAKWLTLNGVVRETAPAKPGKAKD